MKHLSLKFILFFLCLSTLAFGQRRDTLRIKMLKIMFDSLKFSSLESSSIGVINYTLDKKKDSLKTQYGSQPDSLLYHIERVEATRDSLYEAVLRPYRFLLYRQKKNLLLGNNQL